MTQQLLRPIVFTELKQCWKNKSIIYDRKNTYFTYTSPHEAEDVGPPNQNCSGSVGVRVLKQLFETFETGELLR